MVSAPNSLIYALSGYLNRLCDNWSGVVVNDYEAVMPIPWRKKYGIRYIYEAPFIQQLGIFSPLPLPDYGKLQAAIYTFSRYGRYRFNYHDKVDNATSLTNYTLSLKDNYNTFSERFSEDVHQNIRQAASSGLVYTEGDLDEAIDSYQSLYSPRMTITNNQFNQFRKLCHSFYAENKVLVRRVAGKNGITEASLVNFKFKDRLYNIINSVTAGGRQNRANYLLYAHFFREHASTNYLFDFEGSDLPGVASFYRKFGVQNEAYPLLHFNHLPWPLNHLK